MSDAPPPIPPSTPLTVTMTIQQWREMLEYLADGPFRKVGPWIGQIERCCNAELQRIAPQLQRRANGAEERPEAN